MPKISKRVVDAARPGPRPYEIRDSELTGFVLRVHPSGRKSYRFEYRFGQGRAAGKRAITIGRHGPVTPTQARDIAADYAKRVTAGEDPARETAANAATMRDVVDYYMTHHATLRKKASSAAEDRRNFDRHVLPRWGDRAADGITESDVLDLQVAMQGTPVAFNRTRALLSTAFNVARRGGLRTVEDNPCRHVARFRETRRSRILTPEEFERFAAALDVFESYGGVRKRFVAGIRLLLITGARRSEIFRAERAWYDGDRRLQLPDSKSGAKTIVIPAAAKEIIAGLDAPDGNPYLIAGKRDGQPVSGYSTMWGAVLRIAEIENFRMHDQRHVFATAGLELDLPFPTLQSLLGHASVTTTEGYAHVLQLGLDKSTAAVDRVADRLTGRDVATRPLWAVVLGVDATASEADIASAYRRLARAHHPDRGGDDGSMQLLNEAHRLAKAAGAQGHGGARAQKG